MQTPPNKRWITQAQTWGGGGREVSAVEVHERVTKALSVLSAVESLPDTGTHGESCTHRDCVAQRVRDILRGEAS